MPVVKGHVRRVGDKYWEKKAEDTRFGNVLTNPDVEINQLSRRDFVKEIWERERLRIRDPLTLGMAETDWYTVIDALDFNIPMGNSLEREGFVDITAEVPLDLDMGLLYKKKINEKTNHFIYVID